MIRVHWPVLIVSIVLLALGSYRGEAGKRQQRITFYVSTEGNDAWSGKRPGPNRDRTDGPFATLEHARDSIRVLRQAGPLPAGRITVWLRGGTYPLSTTFALTAQDSGTAEAPIVYRAYRDEDVRLIGGRQIEPSWFEPVSDPAILERIDPAAQGQVLQANLKAHGITGYDQFFATMEDDPVPGLELFFQDQPMMLAGWPNEGWARIKDVSDSGSAPRFGEKPDRPGKFILSDERLGRWSQAKDMWLHGSFYWDWYDEYVRVESIDRKRQEISLATPVWYSVRAGGRYYVLNLLEELDTPGEYYLDCDTSILYFWPPDSLENGPIIVSLLKEPLVTMEDVSYVTLRGLTLEASRRDGIVISGGSHNLVAGCTLRNIGHVAVDIASGTAHGVTGCDIYETGAGGIVLAGGDRLTLTPAGNYATNNDIHHYSRWVRTMRPGVLLSGVGNRVAHNLIHDAPHSAIMIDVSKLGNDNVIEYNEIHHVCTDTDDAGAFYIGRDYSARGNCLRYNFFHHIGPGGVCAIYLDDCASGITIFGNIFYQTTNGVWLGGGRDVAIENNIFVNSLGVNFGSRGMMCYDILKSRAEDVHYREPPYSERYPRLAELSDYFTKEAYIPPEGNSIVRNIAHDGQLLHVAGTTTERPIFRHNLTDTDPHFVDREKMSFQLKDDSPAWELGFQRIPMERIGLYRNRYRHSLPPVE